MDGYLSVAEAAAKLGVTRARIHALLTSGRLEGAKVSERCWLVTVASVDARLADPPPQGRPGHKANWGKGESPEA